MNKNQIIEECLKCKHCLTLKEHIDVCMCINPKRERKEKQEKEKKEKR